MIPWKAEPDPMNPGHWRIINSKTLKTIVYGLSERDAKGFAERRNKQQEKREHEQFARKRPQ